MGAAEELLRPWQSPGDIPSLLLLIGGDVVQRAIAQLTGVYVQVGPKLPKVYVTPVAFSFGWVAYAFMTLASVIGGKQLMPPSAEINSTVIECATGFQRANQSWLLGRILRDPAGTLLALVSGSLPQWGLKKWPGRRLNPPRPEAAAADTPVQEKGMAAPNVPDLESGATSLSHRPISPTNLNAQAVGGPGCSSPQGPEVRDDRETSGKPSWKRNKTKPVCLTRGNGYCYAVVIIGSGRAWDLETMAAATSESLPATPWVLGALAIAWMTLLVSVSGIKLGTWYLILVGGLSMVQNVYASSVPRSPETNGLKLTPFSDRPTIIGSSASESDFWDGNGDGEVSDDEVGVRGAIRELEKTLPGAGFSLMPVFFPAIIRFERELYRDSKEARFWKWMGKHPKKEDRSQSRQTLSVVRK
ncbi:hypothetical protein B0T22DRAFT_536974 [Podospora appendiculata]|uniref:Uncharacterized protein n=1 Tax=Podospora appendiculata TaxID=314037 RepID=A0AAE1CDZ4_9PEZI|nr:hypothetical protein B0T22DRAFT_536974 [Podospora appendiculata]